jgi:hypothetical protein
LATGSQSNYKAGVRLGVIEVKILTLFGSLFILCSVLLSVFGDFTGYVWVADRDVWITRPSFGQRFLWAMVIGGAFAFATMMLLALSSLVVTEYYRLRLFLCLGVPFAAVVFFFGDFKTLVGGREVYRVIYELPPGPVRLLISLACGVLLALVTTPVLLAVGFGSTPSKDGRSKGTHPAL